MTRLDRILVHVCCAGCASYVLPHLAEKYSVTAFFYNPNIQPEDEYNLRLEETSSLCTLIGIDLIEGECEISRWSECIEPYRSLPERSERCWSCYGLRIDKTAEQAAVLGFDCFTSTLSVSPHKVHARIVEAGERAALKHGVRFHPEDFKKKNGFKISVERSRELHITRQDYCGCLMSLEEAGRRRAGRGAETPNPEKRGSDH